MNPQRQYPALGVDPLDPTWVDDMPSQITLLEGPGETIPGTVLCMFLSFSGK